MAKAKSKKCEECGRKLSQSNFVKNPNYKDGLDPFCKQCRYKIAKNLSGLQDYCERSRRGFNVQLWNMVSDIVDNKQYDEIEKMSDIEIENFLEKKKISLYFSKMNLDGHQPGYKPKENSEDTIDIDMADDFEVTAEVLARWGSGYTKQDYYILQNAFDRLISSYACETSVQEMLFEEIAMTRLQATKARQEGRTKDYNSLMRTLRELMGDANIKPVQETGANSADQATFGTLIKKWENERPIPEPLEEFKDVDGIKKYINIWFLGHLCKMLNIENSYSQMYEEELSKYTVENPPVETGGDDDSRI